MKDKYKKPSPFSYNVVCPKKGFYISFNPSTLINLVGEPETALCIPRKNEKRNDYFILNGDFRKDYEGKNLKECLITFLEKAENGYLAFWSQSEEDAMKIIKNL